MRALLTQAGSLAIIFATCFLSSTCYAQLAESSVTYDFESGSNEGWSNIAGVSVITTSQGGSTPGRLHEFSVLGSGIDGFGPPNGSFGVAPVNFGDRDGEHSRALVFESPTFKFDTTLPLSISAQVAGGDAGTGAPASDSDPLLFQNTVNTADFQGIALKRVSDGTYLLTTGRTGNGNAFQSVSLSNAAITAAIANDAADESYTIDIIDTQGAGFGWIAVDDVVIEGVLPPDPAFLLLASVGESSDLYADVATHLQGLLAGTTGFEDARVDIIQESNIESLADGYYDQNSEDIAFRARVAEGYRHVILIPTINTTPTGTVEFREFNGGSTNVYDDLPFDNKYFAPEVFYEGVTQLSKRILNAGSTPLIFLPDNADENVAEFGSVMQRVANGVGLDLIPGAQAVQAAGGISDAEQQYLYACSIFTQVTGLNANASTYNPAGIAANSATTLANTAASTLDTHLATNYYTTSYELDGAVVYRNLDLTSAPFNDVIKYAYKGSSTHDFTRDALQTITNADPDTTTFFRKLGTRNGENFGTRYWHVDDVDPDDPQNQLARLTNSNDTDGRAFMFVSGSFAGADAQTVIDLNQANMVPLAFDWIKSFAIPRLNGTASTLDALDVHSCSELYFNYAERGWKLIPLTIGMGRLNEALDDFVTSDDRIHIADPLVYMNAYMMLSSALGTEYPFPAVVPQENIRRGPYTTEDLRFAAQMGHDLIRELAFLSETGDFVPDSDLLISTNEPLEAPVGRDYSFQLSATGGDGNYSWELISGAGLPDGLSLSGGGLLSGTVTGDVGTWDTAFQVTDGTGAFKKVGLKLSAVENLFLLGDCNQDGVVNFLDITPFIQILATSSLLEEADCNQDGVVNFLDITPFIGILAGN